MTITRAAAALLALSLAGYAHAAQPIAGRWLTEDGSAIIQVGPCGTSTCGRIAAVVKPRPGAPTTDVNNPDPSLRNRSMVGLPILSGFTDAGNEWRGRIYDPRNGKSYKSIVTRGENGTLRVKGCISFICQTQVWKAAR
ncbi:DUF2147 domain-containing protein [Sphingomonas sp. IC-11]|uniref:DUF2147 domain-containing protein n=1 Tax=Sphingomonas sp. IC-11 TaxID=2898528 RepID=UPI001E379FA6|nr:DUF2147 domain-containing protein [Sphingomonas sp. IC-11]MCD2315769.1 DUF2147 domain-containing protein [Sphingomonas sp. IC-11]